MQCKYCGATGFKNKGQYMNHVRQCKQAAEQAQVPPETPPPEPEAPAGELFIPLAACPPEFRFLPERRPRTLAIAGYRDGDRFIIESIHPGR